MLKKLKIPAAKKIKKRVPTATGRSTLVMPGDGTLTGRQWLGSAAMATAAAFFALYFSAGRASVRPDVFTRRGRIPGAAGAGIRFVPAHPFFSPLSGAFPIDFGTAV